MSLALIAMVLAILGSLFASYAGIRRRMGDREKTVLGCQAAAESVRRDASSSFLVTIPVTDRLVLELIDPLVTRLPNPLPTPLPASFRPHENGDRMRIEYRLLGDAVMRRVRYSSGAEFEESVATEVDGLSFEMLSNGNLRVSATTIIQGLIYVWRTEAFLHRPKAVYP